MASKGGSPALPPLLMNEDESPVGGGRIETWVEGIDDEAFNFGSEDVCCEFCFCWDWEPASVLLAAVAPADALPPAAVEAD